MWALIALACAATGCFPTIKGAQEDLLLWPFGAPLAKGTDEYDTPRLFLFRPHPSCIKNTVVVVATGGSYGHHGGLSAEGVETVRWLNEQGITAALLRYRLGELGGYDYRSILEDAKRAVRTVRHRAADLGMASPHVGILGYSAGGHLAGWVATECTDEAPAGGQDPIDRESCRVDFAIMVYPVVTLLPPHAHRRSRDNLLRGLAAPDDALLRSLSLELRVRATQPPFFLVHSKLDGTVDFENSVLLHEASKKAGATAELLLVDDGGHGVGLAQSDTMPQMGQWPRLCLEWMQRIRVLQ
jgi:acetyl esterase/lipase